MSWIEIAAIVFGLLGFTAMGAVLAFRIYRNPFLLAGLIPVLWSHVKPVLVKHVLPYFKPLPEDDQKDYDRARRAGRGDEWLRERWRKRRKT